MKSRFLFSLLTLVGILFLNACQVEEEIPLPSEVEVDEMQQMIAITPQQILPDLIISTLTSDLPITQGPCPGGPLPNASCSAGGGPPLFSFTAVVRNISVAPLPAGSFDICWCLANGGGCSSQTVNHNGIPGQGSLTVTSSQFSLPCPVGPPPFGLETKTFFAEVDCTFVVAEANEANNFSRRYFVCDDL